MQRGSAADLNRELAAQSGTDLVVAGAAIRFSHLLFGVRKRIGLHNIMY
jgi:hypothetical protein